MSNRGTISQKPNGRYYVATHYTDEQGKKRQRSHGGYATKRAAQIALTEVLGQIDTGQFIERSTRTLGDYLTDEWLPAKKASIKRGTFDSYARNIRTHVVPRLGNMPLQTVTAPMLTSFYGDLLASGKRTGAGGLAPKTVRYIHTTIRTALKDAVDWGYLNRNPADAAKAPKVSASRHHETKTWQPAEVRSFLEHLTDDRLYAAWLLAASTGMRRGEVLGLRWADIDFDNARLSVRQTLTSVAYELSFDAPKTERGRRSIPLDPKTLEALRTHKLAQIEHRLGWAGTWIDHGLVFTQEDGSPVLPDSFSQFFKRHVRRAGLRKIRLHDLRHTFATNALRAGVPPKVVSDILGHATVAFTMDVYAHVVPSMQADAVDRVADLVWGAG